MNLLQAGANSFLLEETPFQKGGITIELSTVKKHQLRYCLMSCQPSKLIHYAIACSEYQDFIEQGGLLTTRLSTQGYQRTKMVSTLKKFFVGNYDLVNPYNVTVSSLISDVFFLPQSSHKQTFWTWTLLSPYFAKISVQVDRHGGWSIITK